MLTIAPGDLQKSANMLSIPMDAMPLRRAPTVPARPKSTLVSCPLTPEWRSL